MKRVFAFLLACIMFVVYGVGESTVLAADLQQEIPEDKSASLEGNLKPEDEEPSEPEKAKQTIAATQEIELTVGDTFQIEAVTDGEGLLTYESSDPEIAEVDEAGMIQALAEGKVMINVRASETEKYQSAEVQINVEIVKKDWELLIEDLEFSYGDEAKQIVFENPTGNTPVYTVEDSQIASVDGEGNVTPLKVGETTLKIQIDASSEFVGKECQIDIVVKTTLKKPVLLKAAGSKNGVTLTWEKTENAEGYFIYEKVGSGKYKKIDTITDPDVLEYVRKDITDSKKYSYQIEAFTDEGANFSARSNTKTAIYLLAPTVEVSRPGNAVKVKWAQVTGATGYYIYRQTSTNKRWKTVAIINSATTLTWTDKTPAQGATNYYCVKAYYSDSVGDLSASKSSYFLKSPSIKSLSRKKKSKKMTVKWSRNSTASGYQIQYADNRLFHSAKTVTIKKNSTVSKKISKLSKSKTYYVRIRAYKTVNGKKYYSDWTLSSNAKKTKTASYTRLKYKKKTFELKGMAKQSLGGYDTVQGGCSDGKYAYYALYNRKVEKCKIAKVKLSNMKVVKVSGVLNIEHGNDIAYNSSTKRLVVTHTKVNTKRISVIHPSSLKLEKSQDVKIPAKMTGVSDNDLKKMKGFAGIAYNAKRKQYVTFLNSTGDFMILDSNFNPVSYMKPSSKSTLTKQGIDATDDYILVSYSGSTNVIMVYTWDGQYVTKINVKKGYEIENVFHVGKKYYATFYRSYYKNKKLKRDNYVYKISGF